jgi:hypothetical protein
MIAHALRQVQAIKNLNVPHAEARKNMIRGSRLDRDRTQAGRFEWPSQVIPKTHEHLATPEKVSCENNPFRLSLPSCVKQRNSNGKYAELARK